MLDYGHADRIMLSFGEGIDLVSAYIYIESVIDVSLEGALSGTEVGTRQVPDGEFLSSINGSLDRSKLGGLFNGKVTGNRS